MIPGFFPLGEMIRSDVDFDFRDVTEFTGGAKASLICVFRRSIFGLFRIDPLFPLQ